MSKSFTTKEELREYARQWRANLSSHEVGLLSRKFWDHLENEIDWSKVKKLHIYQDISKLQEVQTAGLIAYIKSYFPEIEIYVPVMYERVMKSHLIDTVSQQEASHTEYTGDYDVIIVPCLAADKRGYRLGYGQGNYDTFLADKTATKIGLCYEALVFDEIPTENHDQQLDEIISF